MIAPEPRTVPVATVTPYRSDADPHGVRLRPPGDPRAHMRLHRLFDRLETVLIVVFFITPVTAALLLTLLLPARSDLAMPFWMFGVAGGATGPALRLLWGKDPLRVASHYYRGWLEPKESPRFCALALSGHHRAVASLLTTVGTAWVALLFCTGAGLGVIHREWAAAAIVAGVAGLFAVATGVAARGLPGCPHRGAGA